jgi:hypothetical protein
MYQSRRGIDLSDEGLYLFSADNSNPMASFNSPFGTITSLFFAIAGKEVWKFRFLGVIVLSLAGFILGLAIYNFLKIKAVFDVRTFWSTCIISICSIIPYYGFGLWTPSYNWLNFLAIQLGISGTIFWGIGIAGSNLRHRLSGVMLVSFSIICGVFAKPSTVIVIILMLLITSKLFRITPENIFRYSLELTGTFAVLAILIFKFVESPHVTLEKFNRGYDALKILNPLYEFPNAIKNIPRTLAAVFFDNRFTFLAVLIIFILLLFYATYSGRVYLQSNKRFGLLSLNDNSLALLLIFSSVLVLLQGLWNGTSVKYVNQSRAGITILLVSLVTLLLFHVSEELDLSKLQMNLFLPALFVLGGGAYAFGSGNGFAQQLSGSSGLAFPCAWVALQKVNRNYIFQFLLVSTVLLSVISSSLNSSHSPYRRLPSALQNTKIEISGRGVIYVDEKTAASFFDRSRDLRNAGWINSTPMLDFSSFSTGVVYMHRGQPPMTILPTVNSYPSATSLARWSLKQEIVAGHRELWRCSWIITDSMDPINGLFNRANSVDPRVIKVLGREFPKDYKLVSRNSGLDIWRPQNWHNCRFFR